MSSAGRCALGALIAALAVCAFAGSAGLAAPSGLVAAYSFDEGAGTTVTDSSGSSNNGSVVAATWSTAGKFGKALSFSAAQRSYVSIPDAASLHLSALTLEAWVRPSALSGSWRTVVFKERPGGMTYSLYADNGANRPVGQVYTNAEQDAPGTAQLPLNTWTHLAATLGAGTLKLYVNGAQVSSVAVSGSVIASTGLLKIGGNAIWGEWFNGLIDEVRVYNRALTAGEVSSDMNSSISAAPDTTPPSAPGTLTATGGLGQISLAWGAATDNVGVTKYNVHRSTTAGFTPATANRIAQPTGTGYTDTGLAAGTYYYKVTAEDAAGNIGPVSNEASAAAAADTTPPTTPTSLTATAAPAKVTLSWGASTDPSGIARYNVHRSGTAGFTPAPANLVGQPTATSYVDNGLAAGTYYYKVTATDGAGNTSAASNEANATVPAAPPNFVADTLVTGLDQPTQIVFAPDGRMLILERKGTVRVLQPGLSQPDPTPLLQLSTVNTSDERGALGIVLDPAFASNGFFYVLYTHSSLVNRVSRFKVVSGVAAASSETVLWQNTVSAAIYHQGGGLAFGADGNLYISVGDNLDRASAQSLSSFNGKILRVRSDGSVPTDNPFYDGTGPNADAIWALGLRNPFRISFDSVTGRLFVGDVGEGSWEEVDVAVRGANYGWPTCEGVCGVAGLIDPIFAYPHSGREASITGGFVYRGAQFGSGYDGSYFFGDYAQHTIRRLTFDGTGAVSGNLPFVPPDGALDPANGDPVDLRQGPDGALYYVDIGPLNVANSGKIRRVRNLNGNLPPTVNASASPTSGAAPLNVSFSSAGTYDPEGAALTYSWAFGDGGSSTAANPSHVYSTDGPYTARLTVSDGVNTAYATPIQIAVGQPPVPKITAPVDGSTFQAGQVVNFAGSATDARDGTLTGASLNWTIVFHHETHQHPGPGPFSGGSGSFTTPSSGHDFTGNTKYEIVLTATNSSGLASKTSVFVYPRKVNMTFDSSPRGLTVLVDSLAHTTPYTVDTLVGFRHTISASSPQSLSGGSYSFTSWSDAGAQTHDVLVPTADQTLTATFALTAPARPGLVAAYGFNEGTGTSATDASGNGNTGSIGSAAWTLAGKNGGALSFNGLDALVTVPDAPSLDLTTGMTLEGWVNPSAADGVWRTVVFKERPGGMLYSLYANNGAANLPVGQLFLGNAEQDAVGPATLPLNTWTHLAATYDGSALRLYVNGSLATTFLVSGALAATTDPLRIGGNSIWGEYFSGLIDDVRVYNRALSANEIGTDMAAPVS